jgi:uncharacterized membrane protein required for colicin V production
MTPYLVIDLLVLGVIAFFALRGLKKGLVMAVAGAVIFIVALVGAWMAVGAFSPRVQTFVEPMISGWVESRAVERIPAGADGGLGGVTDTMVYDALRMFGLGENLAQQFAENVSGQVTQAGQGVVYAITAALAANIARMLTFVIAFALITVVLHFAARLLDTIAKLPVLNTFNKLGGLAGGVLQGAVVVWLVVFCLRFVGVFGPETFANTYVLKIFGGMM